MHCSACFHCCTRCTGLQVGCWERCLREPQTLLYKMYWAAGRVLGTAGRVLGTAGRVLGEVSARTSNTAVQDVLGCR